jgi:hypothetical protein
MKCEICGSKTRMQVQAVISAPGGFYHKLSKKNIQRSDVHLLGALWETADFICENPKCKHIHPGNGNYVTRLRKEVKRLKEAYEPEEKING